MASLGLALSEPVTVPLVFNAGEFWAEGETCVWRLLPSESGASVARSRMCGAGLFLEPIKEADPIHFGEELRHVLSQRTKLNLLNQLQTHVRLVDSGDVRMCLASDYGSSLSKNAPYEVPVRRVLDGSRHPYEELDGDRDNDLGDEQMPLANLRPRFIPANKGNARILPLGRVTVAACPTGVIVARGWKDVDEDGCGWDGMLARRLSFLPCAVDAQ